ncbi:MAG: hypothetical protein QOI20_1705 [Acidimicrobiaceae bacterium]|nr:hypothetical protein [Acidimicrobiaceae bacterium]
MPMRRVVDVLVVVLLVAVGALVPAGCSRSSSDDGSGRAKSATSATTAAPGALPPDGTAAMAQAYDDALRPLGWRVQRSEVEHRDTPPDFPPGDRHLSLYLRPTGRPTPADYVAGLASVPKLFLPDLFTRYASLLSFDVCLEPTAADAPEDEPRPVAQVLVQRDEALAFDWQSATPAAIVRRGLGRPNAFALTVAAELRQTPAWKAVSEAALAPT